MIAVITAMACEASPLVNHLGLKKDASLPGFKAYRSESILVVVGGIGKARASVAVAAVMAGVKVARLINLGVCGAPASGYTVGDLFAVDCVVDPATGKKVHLPVETDLPRATLCTVDAPVKGGDMQTLVDMEASGFCEAGLTQLMPTQLSCLKVVSDLFAPEEITSDLVTRLISARLPQIIASLRLCSRGQKAIGERK